MKTAIMQPYLFPYIGYFQLIHAVDNFVLFDDANFIKRGWINRNNILVDNHPFLFTVALNDASQNKQINQITLLPFRKKLLKTISHSYSKASFFDMAYPIIEKILSSSEDNLALFLEHQLRTLCSYLDIYPRWFSSSHLEVDPEFTGQTKILSLCKQLKTSHYINPSGGRHLYDPVLFKSFHLNLSFLHSECLPYPQYNSNFVPNLSIIDVMMFNSKSQLRSLLDQYSLISA